MSDAIDLKEYAIEDAPLVQSHACESCGCPVESADKFCPTCGIEQAIEAKIHEPPPEQRRFRCKNCGAEVAVDIDQRSYTCAFCDSTYVVEFSADGAARQPPEFVIGFAVTEEQAREKFRKWISAGGWFRPGDLSSAQIDSKLKGVYLPFWSFAMLAQSDWSAQIGEYWWKTETYTTRQNGKTVTKTRRVRHTEWWNLSGKHHQYYNGYLISASRGLPQHEADRIKPFHLPALRRYEPYFLAGWLSEEYSIAREQALETCRREFYRREQENTAAHLPGDTYDGLRVSTRFSGASSDLILLPVYLLSYRYDDKVYRFMINGQTGKTAGDKPVSSARIALAVVGGLIAVGAVVGLFALLSSM